MKNTEIISGLKIRKTQGRDEIIQLFTQHPGLALSEAEIGKKIGGHLDRTTIYRTVKTLLDKQFIHQVVCENGILKYALSQTKEKGHVHFQCDDCGKVSCIPEKMVEPVKLPRGYQIKNLHLLVGGQCKSCSKK